MYQYRANVEFDIDGLKDFYIDDLMEQELNIYLMVECWIRDYIDIMICILEWLKMDMKY